MSYHVVDSRGNTLGFSLRPPKWLRKAQPGKILEKVAIPAAVVAGALLIPGVGGALVSAVTGAAGLAAKGASLLGRGVLSAAKDVYGLPLAQVSAQSGSNAAGQVPVPYADPALPGTMPAAPSGAQLGVPEQLPGWLLPVGIGLAAVLLLSARER